MNSRFKIYEDKAGKWRWQLRSINGRIVADSGQGYAKRSECHRAVKRLIEEIKQREIVEVKNA